MFLILYKYPHLKTPQLILSLENEGETIQENTVAVIGPKRAND